MGLFQRRKGARGQSAARALLEGRDWVCDPIACGVKREDLVVTDPTGRAWSCEVKRHRLIDVGRFTTQARGQAKSRRLPWLVLAHVPGSRSWLVLRQGERPQLWHEQEVAP